MNKQNNQNENKQQPQRNKNQDAQRKNANNEQYQTEFGTEMNAEQAKAKRNQKDC
ncbi:hypothetical protein P6709_09630 [Jeotgalibacillus sp. ET6]|uniref:hypothetical protein n=1 Tax=Jeotgalibacillus sp. ET6 TaxID=3037260 RepID=UPI002418231F|nr:hypothetical protein [Jeotgalibacillus sp. ET6]MDG5472010.1 hypothetical protein [Jeotgalibacillus sp. ET6]